MKTNKFPSWLPIFSGFYGTRWEQEDLIDNYKEYETEATKRATKFVERELKSLKLAVSVEYENVYSPREYNFVNDYVNATFVLSNTNLLNLKKYINKHKDAFDKYLKDHYTSHAGFISFHSNFEFGWREKTKNYTEFNAHQFGAIMDFILTNEQITEEEMFDYCSDIYYMYAEMKVE